MKPIGHLGLLFHYNLNSTINIQTRRALSQGPPHRVTVTRKLVRSATCYLNADSCQLFLPEKFLNVFFFFYY